MDTTLRPVTDRFSLHHQPQPERIASFADDVRAGLGKAAKTLPPRYFYDDLGSALFEAITKLPEYYLTRLESSLLERYAGEMIGALAGPLELVELGSGSAVKTRYLIEAALARQARLTYHPVDISPEALIASSHALIEAHPALSIAAYASDYFALLERGKLATQERVLALFLGSNIGNYEPAEARLLLGSLSRALSRGDGLLLGTDLKKDAGVLELAYDDPAGVTAAFDKNILGRINRELGGEFDLRTFEHVVRYDAVRGSVDSFLESQVAQRVFVRELALHVQFTAGERIHTESSYKFSLDDIAALAADTGFTVMRSWTDPLERYGLTMLAVR